MSEPHGSALPSVRQHWLPSLPATAFIGLLLFIIFGFQEPLLNSDGDLARHLRHGEWMLQHHSLIHADPFSFSRPNAPFVAFEYGSQLIYALVYRVGGLATVTVFAALLLALAYSLLTLYMLRRGVEPLLAAAVVGTSIISGMGHWLARPHLMTMVAVPVLLELVTPVGPRRVWPFVPLFILWANLHGGFVYGLVLIGIVLAAAIAERLTGDRTERGRIGFLAAALVLASAATLLTPHGIALHRHIFAALNDRYVLDHTGEFASPNFHDIATKLFLAVLLAVVGAAFWSRRRPSATTAFVTLAGIYFALVSQRNITLFGLTALPLIAIHLDPEWRTLPFLARVRHGFERSAAGASTLGWMIPAALIAVALGVRSGTSRGNTLIGNEFSRARLPVAAIERTRAAGLAGRLFADFGWGGYIVLAWPEQKVFIDGGADFYGGALMRDYSTIRSMRPGWRELMDKWQFSVMLVRPDAPLAPELARAGTWTYWYCDSTAVVLIRADAPAPRISSGADLSRCGADRDVEPSAS